MRKVNLRMNELEKYEKIKELVEHRRNKNHVALQLGLTVRQVNRLIIKYKEKGKSRIHTRQPFKETCKNLRQINLRYHYTTLSQ